MEENTPSEKMEKRGPGQPKLNIDWKKVEDLLMSGCMGTGIAAYLGISAQTLYDRCLIEKGILFSQFSQEKKEKGDEILRAHQYAKALGLTEKGDNTLLIWLGKTRLKQVDAATQVASGNTFTIKVDKDGIGTGVNISAKEIPVTDNQSPKSGD